MSSQVKKEKKQLVKRPQREILAAEDDLFKQLEQICIGFNKDQFKEGLAALTELAEKAKKAKADGMDTKAFDTELKRQQNRTKMDEFDAKQAEKLTEEKKQGVD